MQISCGKSDISLRTLMAEMTDKGETRYRSPPKNQETVKNNLGRQSANTAFLNSISYLKRLVINESSICRTGEH